MLYSDVLVIKRAYRLVHKVIRQCEKSKVFRVFQILSSVHSWKSKVSRISIKPFHYKPLNFSIVSSEKHTCPVFFRVVFSCFLNNIFYSEERGKETRGILLRCHFCFCFSLVKAVFNCFEKQVFYSILKFYISILTWGKIALELKVSIYLFFVMI